MPAVFLALEVLEAAKVIISDQRKWTSRSLAEDEDGRFCSVSQGVRWNVTGALMHAADRLDTPSNALAQAHKALVRAAHTRDLAGWCQERTHEEACDLITRAINILEGMQHR